MVFKFKFKGVWGNSRRRILSKVEIQAVCGNSRLRILGKVKIQREASSMRFEYELLPGGKKLTSKKETWTLSPGRQSIVRLFFSEKEGCGNEAVKVIQSFKPQHVRGAYQVTDIAICRCPQSLSLTHLFSSKIHLKSKILHKNDEFYIFCKFILLFDGHLMYY